MPRTARSYDSAFASDAESDQKQNKATSICELSSYEKLNSGQTDHDQGEGTGKSDASSGTSSPSSSPSSSDESTARAPNPDKNKNRVSLGGAGRHTKRLVDMKTAAAVAKVHKSGSVGANKVAAASAAKSTAKKATGNGGRRSANGNIGSAKKKGSTEKKAKKPAAVAAATKKRKKQSASNAKTKTKTKPKEQATADPKPPASVAMPGRLVRISDYRRRMEPSPVSSPIHRVNLTFTPEAMEAAGSQKQKQGKGKKTADTVATGTSKKRSAAMVSGGTGRFNIKQE